MSIDREGIQSISFPNLVALVDFCLGNRQDMPEPSLEAYITYDQATLLTYVQILEQMVAPRPITPQLLPVPASPSTDLGPLSEIEDVLTELTIIHNREYEAKAKEFDKNCARLQPQLAIATKKVLELKEQTAERTRRAHARLKEIDAEAIALADAIAKIEGELRSSGLRRKANPETPIANRLQQWKQVLDPDGALPQTERKRTAELENQLKPLLRRQIRLKSERGTSLNDPELLHAKGVLNALIHDLNAIKRKFETWKAIHNKKNLGKMAAKRIRDQQSVAIRQMQAKQARAAEKAKLIVDENQKRLEKAHAIYDRQVRKHRLSIRRRIIERLKKELKSGKRFAVTGRLPWELLPSGKIDRAALERYIKSLPWSDRVYDETRVDLLLHLSPDEVYTGRDDFAGYIVFIYKRSGVAVLDCPFVGNAIYTFGEDWRQLSQRTKQDLLAHTFTWRVKRFVHRGDWKNRLIRHIRSPQW